MAGEYYRQRREKQSASGPAAFDPVALSGGAVTGWLRNTSAAGAFSQWQSQIDSNHATQAVTGRQPTSNADGSVEWIDAADSVSWPLTAANNGASQTGFAFWVDPNSVGVVGALLSIMQYAGSEASVRKLELLHLVHILRIQLYDPDAPGANGREAQCSGAITATPQFLTFEFDGPAATEVLRLTATRNAGAPLTFTFANIGTPVHAITALPVPTGFAIIGAITNGGGNQFAGRFGKNLYALGAKQAGATTGLLTAAARTALMNFEPLI